MFFLHEDIVVAVACRDCCADTQSFGKFLADTRGILSERMVENVRLVCLNTSMRHFTWQRAGGSTKPKGSTCSDLAAACTAARVTLLCFRAEFWRGSRQMTA